MTQCHIILISITNLIVCDFFRDPVCSSVSSNHKCLQAHIHVSLERHPFQAFSGPRVSAIRKGESTGAVYG